MSVFDSQIRQRSIFSGKIKEGIKEDVECVCVVLSVFCFNF